MADGAAGPRTYHLDGTLLLAHLPRPLAPGDSVEFQVAWHFTVPPADAPRTGRSDHAVYQVAQWYPQIAVYDDLAAGTRPLPRHGEFYLEYGDFDVAITVPEGWLVAATGELQNPDEVLTDLVRERLAQALRSDSVVHVVTADDLGAGQCDAACARRPAHLAVRGSRRARLRVRRVQPLPLGRDARRDRRRRGRPRDIVAVHAFYRPEPELARRRALHAARPHVHGRGWPSVHLPANHGGRGAGLAGWSTR